MISSENLHFSYTPDRKFSFPDLHCDDNQTLLILGQSGKGKTTLLHLLALLLRPAAGKITVDNSEVSGSSASDLASFRAQKIGIIYQRAHFVGALTVLDNILMPNYLAKIPLNKERAMYLTQQLGISEHLSKKTNQLSQGEQQRVSIARALMNRPSIILADEPTSSLDDNNCEKVIQLLKTQASDIGASLVVVTHDYRLKNEFSNQVFL
jgi:lipoprotein-releasing system ATP-binding protein